MTSSVFKDVPDIVEFPDSSGIIVVLVEIVSFVSKVDSSRVTIKDELLFTVTSTLENKNS